LWSFSVVRYFKGKPQSQSLFKKFKNRTLDDLRVDEELEQHAGKVMAVFDECVQSIDNVDLTIEVMHRTAALHKGISGFSSHMYMVSFPR